VDGDTVTAVTLTSDSLYRLSRDRPGGVCRLSYKIPTVSKVQSEAATRYAQ
jgi:hypothetical protein